MTQLRIIHPATTWHITRRTTRRFFLFRPLPFVRQLFLYVLGLVAQKYGIVIHAAVLMSTHEHLVLTDPHGVLPKFVHDLHRLVAMGFKAKYAWEGEVWDKRPTSYIQLVTPEAVLKTIAYVLANPVEAGAVKHAHQWPGVWTPIENMGGKGERVARPKSFFSKSQPASQQVTWSLPTSIVEAYGGEAPVKTALKQLLREREERAKTQIHQQGKRFMGAEQAKTIEMTHRSQTIEEAGQLKPIFAIARACQTTWNKTKEEYRAFHAAYKEAFSLWRKGRREVLFPWGTWKMKVLHCVNVASAP